MSTNPDEHEDEAPEDPGAGPDPGPVEGAPDGPSDEEGLSPAARSEEEGLSPAERALRRAQQPVAGEDPEEAAAERPDPEDVSLKGPTLALLVPIALITLGVLVRRELFWDRFVYRYYWEPIVLDSGFTTVNTISWAILMALLIWFLTRLLQRLDQPVTFAMILATTPYMMGGSVTRVMQDSGFFMEPLRYFFITPIIYVVITAVAVVWLVIGVALRRRSQEVGLDNALKALASLYAVIFIVYVVWGQYGQSLSDYGHPLVLLLALGVPLAYFWSYTRQVGEVKPVGVMATFGMAFFLFALHYVFLWQTGAQWDPIATDMNERLLAAQGMDLRSWVFLVMIAMPAAFVALVVAVARTRPDSVLFAAYLAPINLLIIAGQVLDASMTSLGIDFLKVSSAKHVLPSFLIGWMDENGPGIFGDYPTTTVMMTAKILVALLVVWAIDVYAREDMKEHPDLVGLAKLAIIMVGLAPGFRDGVRLAMDV